MSQHTPGPWIDEPFLDKVSITLPLAVTDTRGDIIAYLPPKSRTLANARLIAKAPEMYRSLKVEHYIATGVPLSKHDKGCDICALLWEIEGER